MTCLFCESFDSLGGSSDVTTRGFVPLGGTTSFSSSTTTAFNRGKSGGAIVGTWPAFDTATNESTVYFSVRLTRTGATTASSSQALIFNDGANQQVTIQFAGDGSVTVRTGGTAGTQIGSLPANSVPASQWLSIQGKLVVHNTAGSLELRTNGSALAVLLLSNVNTRGGSTNNYCNGFSFAVTSTGGNILLDDLWLNNDDGISPAGWPGDMHAETLVPTVTTQAQFVPNGTTTVGHTSTTSTSSASANTLYFGTSEVTPAEGTVTAMSVILNAGFTGNIKGAIYLIDASGNAALLGTTNPLANPVAGANTLTFPSALSIAANQAIRFAVVADTAFVFKTGPISSSLSTGQTALTYASAMPATVTSTTFAGPAQSLALSTAFNFSNAGAVSEAVSDGDSSYVSSSTVSAEDLYAVTPLPTTPPSITGIRFYMISKKSDAGTRTAALQCQANGTEASVVLDAPGVSYALRTKLQLTDPTGAPWTAAVVNAMRLGPKVVS